MNENPYDALLSSPQQALRASVAQAADKNPDSEAKLQALSRYTGVPLEAVRLNPKPAEQQARTMAMDYDELVSKLPATAAHLADPNKAATSYDDLENMSAIERALRYVVSAPKAPRGGLMSDLGLAVGAGVAGIQRGGANTWGAARAGFDILAPALDFAVGTVLPENPLRRASALMQANQRAAEAGAKYNTPQTDSVVGAGVVSGIGSLADNTTKLPLLLAGPSGLQAYLAAMTLPVFGEGYTKGKDAGMGTLPAVGLGASQAVIEYATEKIPALWLLKDLKAGTGLAKTLAHQAVREVPGEQVATALQDLNEWAVLNPAKPFKDYLAERPGAAAQTLIATLIGTGGQVTLMHGLDQAMNGAQRTEAAAKLAQDRAQLLAGLDTLAKASKVRERDASSFEAFIKSAAEDGPVANVYIDPKVLMQSGLADKLAEASPAIREQLPAALATGTDVRIPLEDFTTNIAGTELAQGLLEDLKTDPGGMTKREADAAIKGQVESLRTEFDARMEQLGGDVVRREAADQVREQIKTQLEQAGRFRADVNEAFASMVASFYNTMGARLGITAGEMFAKYPLRVQAQGMLGGAVLDQGGVSVSASEWQPAALGEQKMLLTAKTSTGALAGRATVYKLPSGEIQISDIKTEEGHRGKGVATRLTDAMFSATGADLLRYSSGTTADGTAFFQKYGEQMLDGRRTVVRPRRLEQSALPPTLDIDGKQRPTTNSKGQPIAGTEEAVRNFWRWFGDSKVVDDQGRPLVVYHGTAADFSEFKDTGRGTFFAESPETANTFSSIRKGDPRVLPAYLSIANPWEMRSYGLDTPMRDQVDQSVAALKAQGYDGTTRRADGVWVAFSPEQIKSATGNRGTFDPASGNILEQPAYHGSPHRFDRFSTDHMGTGEGAQAYGWGLYFASLKDVARTYVPRDMAVENKMLAKYKAAERQQDYEAMEVWERALDHKDGADLREFYTEANGYDAAMRAKAEQIAKQVDALLKTSKDGHLYAVDIPEDSEMLDWDKPLSEQPDKVREALEPLLQPLAAQRNAKREEMNAASPGRLAHPIVGKLASKVIAVGDIKGADAYAYLGDFLQQQRAGEGATKIQRVRAGNADKMASEYLASLGIKGIRYLDGQSRSDGEGSHNYVVFSGDDVAIRNQFYQKARGTYNPEHSTITLLSGADLSTFLHESGHHFLEVQMDVAAQLAAKDPAALTPGERELAADASTVLQWFGVSTPAEWFALPFEEKRSYHERFARGFEAYLVDGTAPSLELAQVFQRFRSWLLNVYKDIKRMMGRDTSERDATGKALDVKLSDEVRQVFDRMLASNEEIVLAEQGRSMLPIFASQADAGMTAEEWAAYQAQGEQHTQDAVHDLEGRGVRDLKWLRNARSRKFKELQAEAEALRAAERAVVRTQVMSRPVYRAWAFLTGDISPEDKITPKAPRKPVPGMLDATVDPLLVAIGKLGGISLDSAVRKLGLGANEPLPRPRPGIKGAVQRSGGMSADQMAERLAEAGYLNTPDRLAELEEKFNRELGGDLQYSIYVDADVLQGSAPAGEDLAIGAMQASRLDRHQMTVEGYEAERIAALDARGMVSDNGVNADMVAEQFGFTSGDQLTRELAEARPPEQEVEDLTDIAMLEKHGELASPEAIERAADRAIHNDARARFVATELQALEKAVGPMGGKRPTIARAAREFAASLVARQKVRDVRPSLYANAGARAGRNAAKAQRSGDIALAAAEKRNQLVNTYAAKEAHKALDEVDALRKYLAKFDEQGKRGAIHVDYLDQIDTLLDRFDLRKSTSTKSIDKMRALADWVADQEALGIEVDLPAKVKLETWRESYKELTVEELRGLADTVRTIEHLGRLKERMLTALDNRRFADIVAEVVASIREHGGDQLKDNRTRDTTGNRAARLFEGFLASHRKTASLAREIDGFKDAGPMWRYLIASMNRAGDKEASMRAEATTNLGALLKPVLAQGSISGRGKHYPSLGLSLNKSEVLTIALNLGNAGNQQRLLDGRGWTLDSLQPALATLTPTDWQFVQSVWDLFESYRPLIAAKERRVMGKEPEWVDPLPVTTPYGELRGGYFPIVYDPRESAKAEQFADAEAAKRDMRGAFVASTTRRTFTKTRSEEVKGRPLLLTWDAMFRGLNDVVHDLSWHEWVIDANRLMRNDAVASAIREHYGAEVAGQFKTAIKAIAAGESNDLDKLAPTMRYLRSGAAVAGLGFNLMNAMLQPLGLTQSMVRIGPRWVAKGIAAWAASPVELVKDVHERSEFMRNRARTQQREVNEIQSVVRGQGPVRQKINALMFLPMQSLQLVADMPTWWGAYQKALAGGSEEQEAVQLADQAVLDAQSGGQIKDLAAIQRGGELQKLFTVFYGFFSSSYNLGVERAKATNYRSPLEVMHLAGDFLLLYSVPAVMAALLKEALQPGGDDDPEKLARKLIGEQISYLLGLLVGVREITGAVQYATGTRQFDTAYSGPAGLRFFQELDKLGKQVGQGDLDRAMARAAVNVGGVLLHLPSGQANRTIDGLVALMEGKTENPGALAFGFDKGGQ